LASSAGYSRLLALCFTAIIGVILWWGVLADPSGGLKPPGAGSVVYVVVVIGVAALLAYADRKGDSS